MWSAGVMEGWQMYEVVAIGEYLRLSFRGRWSVVCLDKM
jgi:hypothetical protein